MLQYKILFSIQLLLNTKLEEWDSPFVDFALWNNNNEIEPPNFYTSELRNVFINYQTPVFNSSSHQWWRDCC